MKKTTIGNFSNTETGTNVVLQNNSIKITFEPAIDKTRSDQSKINYRVRYITQPLYLNDSAATYAFIDEHDPKTTSKWANVTTDVVEDNRFFTVTTPTLDFDQLITYEIQALDDYSTSAGPIAVMGPFCLLVNRPARVRINMIDWDSEDHIQIVGTMIDTGFSVPANYAGIKKNNAAWAAWRNDLAEVFGGTPGDGVTFTYEVKISETAAGIDEETPTGTGNSFLLKTTGSTGIYDYYPGSKIEISMVKPTGLSSDNSYYFKLFLTKSGILSTANAAFKGGYDTTANLMILTSNTPVFQIKKGVVKANIPNSNKGKTGGGMFSHGTQTEVDDDYDAGHSIALYDHHIKSDSTPANEPSIGFFDVNNDELASIALKEIGGETVLTMKSISGGEVSLKNDNGLVYYDTEAAKWKKTTPEEIISGGSFDDIEQTGFYSTINTTEGPVSGGFFNLIVVRHAIFCPKQIAFEEGSGEVYYRFQNNDSTWSGWSKLAIGDHSSTETTFGVATTEKYGHVKVPNNGGLALSNGSLSLGAHASPSITYGIATDTDYGHVKVTPGNGLAISDGILSIPGPAPGNVLLWNSGTPLLPGGTCALNDDLFKFRMVMVKINSFVTFPLSAVHSGYSESGGELPIRASGVYTGDGGALRLELFGVRGGYQIIDGIPTFNLYSVYALVLKTSGITALSGATGLTEIWGIY